MPVLLLLLFVVLFLQHGGGRYGIVVVQAQQADALGRAAGLANFVGVDADDFAVVGDDHHVGLFGDLQSGDYRAVTIGGLHVDNALAAARGDAVFGQRRPLSETFFGDGEHQRGERTFNVLILEFFQILRSLIVFLNNDVKGGLHGVHANHVIFLVEIHAVDAAGTAAHGPDFRFAEKDGLAFVAGQENHFLA